MAWWGCCNSASPSGRTFEKHVDLRLTLGHFLKQPFLRNFRYADCWSFGDRLFFLLEDSMRRLQKISRAFVLLVFLQGLNGYSVKLLPAGDSQITDELT